MLEPLKCFSIFQGAIFIATMLLMQSCFDQNIELSNEDLKNPDIVVNALESGISNDRKDKAQLFYDEGIEALAQKKWGPADKSLGTSALYYPTSKAFIKLSDATANIYMSNEQDDGSNRLSDIKKYLESAVAINSFEPRLSNSELDDVKASIACISNFLESKENDSPCMLVDQVKASKN